MDKFIYLLFAFMMLSMPTLAKGQLLQDDDQYSMTWHTQSKNCSVFCQTVT